MKKILLENEIKEKNKKLELLKDNINNFFLKMKQVKIVAQKK